jgi:redox-sensitive bicupin YhaK (pirin superfamily)
VVVLGGAVTLAGRSVGAASVAVLGLDGDDLAFVAGDGGAEILLLAGAPIDEPIAAHGPFVMNTREEIRAAMADYAAGRMGRLD